MVSSIGEEDEPREPRRNPMCGIVVDFIPYRSGIMRCLRYRLQERKTKSRGKKKKKKRRDGRRVVTQSVLHARDSCVEMCLSWLPLLSFLSCSSWEGRRHVKGTACDREAREQRASRETPLLSAQLFFLFASKFLADRSPDTLAHVPAIQKP